MRLLTLGLLTSFLVIGFFLGQHHQVYARYDPLSVANNKFGIHILNRDDILSAATLVNSNGGGWGYVTLVILEDERDPDRWQPLFEDLRRQRLIPIVRLATRFEIGYWVKPKIEDTDSWVSFLNSLNWVIQNRYIILFNEPNQAKEWGGEIKPEEYADVVQSFHNKLRSASADFFILPAGLDLAASTTNNTLAPDQFIDSMHQSNADVFKLLDGWTSHSYPNPNFSGSPYDRGRTSIRGYEWELNYVAKLGFDPKKPVFITETGWQHNDGKNPDRSLLSPRQISTYLQTAYTSIWNQPNIVAITPFILNYPDEPFANFSWTQIDTGKPMDFYETVRQLPKLAGKPTQINHSQVTNKFFPSRLITTSSYSVALKFKNSGQSIWEGETISVKVDSSLTKESFTLDPVSTTEPGHEAKIWLNLETPPKPGHHSISVQLMYQQQPFGEQAEYQFTVTDPTDALTQVRLMFDRVLLYREFFRN